MHASVLACSDTIDHTSSVAASTTVTNQARRALWFSKGLQSHSVSGLSNDSSHMLTLPNAVGPCYVVSIKYHVGRLPYIL